MKHAYLIIAHNEFEHLQRLVSALDDDRNDIYIHIDRRVKQLPQLKTSHSRIVILDNRIKVIWGHQSQPECEMILMEKAILSDMHYDFFHIISGTHYPLVDKDSFNEFFTRHKGKSVFQLLPFTEDEMLMRFGLYHFLMKRYSHHNEVIAKKFRFMWKVILWCQKKIGIRRDYSFLNGKSSNWCALTEDAVKTILTDRPLIRKRIYLTFCSDEWYKLSVLGEHNLPIDYTNRLLFQEFQFGNPRPLTTDDYDAAKKSGCLFGRKFTNESASLVTLLDNEQD